MRITKPMMDRVSKDIRFRIATKKDTKTPTKFVMSFEEFQKLINGEMEK